MSDDNDAVVTVLWEAKAKPGREQEMKAFMTNAVTASRADAGCIEYEAHEVIGEPGTFVIFERWISKRHLDAHLGAARMQDLVPQLLELMQGSIEGGIRLLKAFRPSA